MSEAKFTKGPWHIEHDSNFDECVVHANRGEERVDICEVSTYVTVSNNDNCIDVDQILSNADLIHAAPDMYEALELAYKNCLGRYGISKDSNECVLYVNKECMIARALRKARGGGE